MKPAVLQPCQTLARRIAFDKRRGHTTSEAAKDFVRRTCPCDSCVEGRRPPPLQVRTTLEVHPGSDPGATFLMKSTVA
jgi:hypothetical protein